MIRSFKDKQTERLFHGHATKFPPDIVSRAKHKLRAVDEAQNVDDLKSPPGNHLEVLSGDRAGQHSIRINAQWRICFFWEDGNARAVEILDYH